MERERLDKEPEAETPLPHVPRATSMPASTGPTAQGEETSDPSPRRDREHSAWTGAGLAMHLPARMRDVLKRYGLALALASLALAIRAALPVPEGTAIYQLPIVAVVLSAWFGGRGPGLFASLICAATILYRFIPPADSFELSSDYALGFLIFIALGLLLSEFGSGRRRAEHARRASEERFRALVQFSFDVYWESDAEHRFTRQEFSERLTDAPARGAELGKTRWEIPYVEPDEEAWRKHRATLDAHLPFRDFELARPTADGGTRYISVSGIPAFDEIGRFVGYRGVGRHITERKRGEAERRAHVWFLESLDRIHRAMQGTRDLGRMLDAVLAEVLEIFRCDRALVSVNGIRGETSWCRRLAIRLRPGCEHPDKVGMEYIADRDTHAMRMEVRAAGRPVQLVLGSVPEHVARVHARYGAQSVLSMPIDPKYERLDDDHFYYFTVDECSVARVWTAEEMRLFEEIGHRLADALGGLIALRNLQESERRSEAAQRLARVGWWERDYLSDHVSLSDEACRIFGVQPLGLPQWQERWMSLIHPDDREKTAAASEMALGGGPRYDVEYRVVRPDGTVRVVHSQGDVTRDESGGPVRQFGAMQDITELRRAEDERRASETRFRTFVDHATDAFFLLDEQLLVVDVNRHACESLGWSREELIGMHPGEFDVGLDEPSIARLAQRAGAGEIVTFETRHRRKDGTAFPVEIRTGTFKQGRDLFYLALARDITERKRAEEGLREREAGLRESEQRYRTLFEKANDAIFLENDRDDIIEVNERACALLGYSRDELLRMKVPDLQAPEARGQAGRVIREETDKHGDAAFESVDLHRSGRRISVEVTNSGISDRGENLILSVVRDISERKIAEEKLREKDDALQMARTELERMSRLTTLGELTTSIAHEVSQPLGAMVASAGACVRWLGADPPAMAEARSALDNIVADGKRAREVIARIRALTKRQAPRMDLLDLNRKILEVLAFTEQELRSHDIVLQTRLDSTLPQVTGDRVQLQQVLLNLIVNAIEAISAVNNRPRELTIVTAQGTDGVVVEVRDSGIGLDPDGAERVFEAFYTTKTEGIGIGLSISRSIVEAHGGRLWATPNEPHGAVFRFSLPVAEDRQS
jgi:PAS domain S-box-containing protein